MLDTTLRRPTSRAQAPPEIRFCQEIANSLGRSYLRQCCVTILPLMMVDAITIAVLLSIGMGVASVFFAMTVSVPILVILGLSWITLMGAFGLYHAIGLNPAAELRRYLLPNTVLAITVLTGNLLTHFSGGVVAITAVIWIASLPALTTMRLAARCWLAQKSWWGIRCIVADHPAINHFNPREVTISNRLGYRIVGYVSESEPFWEDRDASSYSFPYVGPIAELHDVCRTYGVATLIISSDGDTVPKAILSQMLLHFPRIERLESHSVGFSQDRCLGSTTTSLAGNALLHPGHMALKRAMDLSLIVAAAPMWLPLFCAIALMTKLTSRGPVFYRQRRVGRYGHTFGAWKFRTMVQNADDVLNEYLEKHPELQAEWDRDHKLKKDPRITRFGSILRKSSLDELPQLLNVLIGEMSLVGPRPIVALEIPKYAEAYPFYQAVRPGLTGLWQVNGRNNTSYEERITMDRFYVSTWSVPLDTYILLRTVKTVAFCEGAY